MSLAATAQLSPGPLSRPHLSLNGPTNCASCHKFGGQAALKCLECHTEIAGRLSSHRGLHATYNIPSGSSQECARCHSEHNGEDFPLIKWDIKTFNHKDTGYLLEGKHAGLACNKCHNPSHITPPERTTIKTTDLNRTYLGLSDACVTCHEDQHKGRLGPACSSDVGLDFPTGPSDTPPVGPLADRQWLGAAISERFKPSRGLGTPPR